VEQLSVGDERVGDEIRITAREDHSKSLSGKKERRSGRQDREWKIRKQGKGEEEWAAPSERLPL
jgi:hypothetical protein